ncbi:hypothetical protein B9479_007430, partial [Cryptococcus floricola]
MASSTLPSSSDSGSDAGSIDFGYTGTAPSLGPERPQKRMAAASLANLRRGPGPARPRLPSSDLSSAVSDGRREEERDFPLSDQQSPSYGVLPRVPPGTTSTPVQNAHVPVTSGQTHFNVGMDTVIENVGNASQGAEALTSSEASQSNAVHRVRLPTIPSQALPSQALPSHQNPSPPENPLSPQIDPFLLQLDPPVDVPLSVTPVGSTRGATPLQGLNQARSQRQGQKRGPEEGIPRASKRSAGPSRIQSEKGKEHAKHVSTTRKGIPMWLDQIPDIDFLYPPTMKSKNGKYGATWTAEDMKSREEASNALIEDAGEAARYYQKHVRLIIDKLKSLTAKTGAEFFFVGAHPKVYADHGKAARVPYTTSFVTQGFMSSTPLPPPPPSHARALPFARDEAIRRTRAEAAERRERREGKRKAMEQAGQASRARSSQSCADEEGEGTEHGSGRRDERGHGAVRGRKRGQGRDELGGVSSQQHSDSDSSDEAIAPSAKDHVLCCFQHLNSVVGPLQKRILQQQTNLDVDQLIREKSRIKLQKDRSDKRKDARIKELETALAAFTGQVPSSQAASSFSNEHLEDGMRDDSEEDSMQEEEGERGGEEDERDGEEDKGDEGDDTQVSARAAARNDVVSVTAEAEAEVVQTYGNELGDIARREEVVNNGARQDSPQEELRIQALERMKNAKLWDLTCESSQRLFQLLDTRTVPLVRPVLLQFDPRLLPDQLVHIQVGLLLKNALLQRPHHRVEMLETAEDMILGGRCDCFIGGVAWLKKRTETTTRDRLYLAEQHPLDVADRWGEEELQVQADLQREAHSKAARGEREDEREEAYRLFMSIATKRDNLTNQHRIAQEALQRGDITTLSFTIPSGSLLQAEVVQLEEGMAEAAKNLVEGS